MIGRTISHYKILEKIGEGGMGVVYKARDTKLDRDVALKFLPSNVSADSSEKQRFILEAKAASALQHHNICTIHDIDETKDGQLFIVMDCYEGITLKEKLKQGPLDIKEAVDIAIQLADGLDKAHKNGIIHRDIKPANIIITSEGVAKILDFGLAKLSGQSQLTKVNSTVGTIAYMSSEQTKGQDVDQRTDIWSFGVVLYEMLTGYLPFKGDYEQAVIYSILNEDVKFPPKNKIHVPIDLQNIIIRALAKDPSERYKTAQQIIHDLKSEKVEAHPRINNHLVFMTILIVILVGIAFTIFYRFISNNSRITNKVVSVAVLYLTNLGPKDEEFYSYGLTEDLIIDISNAGLVRVPTINDIKNYKESELSLIEIAKELDVTFIITGSFRKNADQFRLAMQLIEAETGRTLLSERWEESWKNISLTKYNLTKRIIQALDLAPSESWYKEIKKKSNLNSEAYELFQQGSFRYRHRKNTNDLEIARGLLARAIELDSTFVTPRQILGESYMRTGEFDQAIINFEAASRIAETDSNYNAAASILQVYAGVFFYKQDFNKGLELLNRAIELSRITGSKVAEAAALGNMGSLYYMAKNYDKTIELYLQALSINKELNFAYGEVTNLNNIGFLYMSLQDYEKAITYLTQCIEKSELTNFYDIGAEAKTNLGQIYIYKEDFPKALLDLEQAMGFYESIKEKRHLSQIYIYIAYAESKMGNYTNITSLIEKAFQITDYSKMEIELLWLISKVFALSGNKQDSNTYLEHAYTKLSKEFEKLDTVEKKESFIKSNLYYDEIVAAWEKYKSEKG